MKQYLKIIIWIKILIYNYINIILDVIKIAKYFKIDINNFNRNVKISMELINN